MTKLARLVVEIVDAAHSRSFHDEWNKCMAKDKIKPSESGARTYFNLTPDWTAEKECRRRDWERSSFMGSLSLLRKEGTCLGGCVRGKKGRKKIPVVKFEGFQEIVVQ